MNEPRPADRDLPSPLADFADRTPARLFVGRAGGAYPTRTLLELRADHAFARDAVGRDLAISDLGDDLVDRFDLFEVSTRATSRREFLLRPDLGRSLSEEAKAEVSRLCPRGAEIQIVLGDGLSAAAVRAQVPSLLPALDAACRVRGWTVGRPFLVRHGRVGVLNDVGELLDPSVVVLLIGERPGLATAESLSAYMAHRPRSGHDDSRRNLISNIHARGVPVPEAARRIAAMAARMMDLRDSGVAVKEEGLALDAPRE